MFGVVCARSCSSDSFRKINICDDFWAIDCCQNKTAMWSCAILDFNQTFILMSIHRPIKVPLFTGIYLLWLCKGLSSILPNLKVLTLTWLLKLNRPYGGSHDGKIQVRFCRLKFADHCNVDSIFYLMFWEADGGRGTSTSLTRQVDRNKLLLCENWHLWENKNTQKHDESPKAIHVSFSLFTICRRKDKLQKPSFSDFEKKIQSSDAMEVNETLDVCALRWIERKL